MTGFYEFPSLWFVHLIKCNTNNNIINTIILKKIATFLSCFNFNSKHLFGIILPKIKGIVKFLFDYTLKY